MRFELGMDALRRWRSRGTGRRRAAAGAVRLPGTAAPTNPHAAIPVLAMLLLALAMPAGPAQAGEVISETRPEVEMTVTDDGVAGIGAHTPFDPMAVRQELPPGYTVSMASYGGSGGHGEPMRMINVLRSDIPVLSVIGDANGNVSLVQVLSPRIGVGRGTIGDRFDRFFAGAAEGDCARGEDRLSAMVVCTPTEGRQVSLLFEEPQDHDPDDANGHASDRHEGFPAEAELAAWRLRYVIWSATPAPPADPGAADG